MTREQLESAYIRLKDTLIEEYSRKVRSRVKAEDLLHSAFLNLLEMMPVLVCLDQTQEAVDWELRQATDAEREKDRQEGRKAHFISLDEPYRKHPGEQVEEEGEDRGLQVPDTRMSPVEQLGESWDIERVRKAMAQLEGKKQALIRMVWFEGMRVEDAAKALGMRLGTARTHYKRAKRTLARLLRDKLK